MALKTFKKIDKKGHEEIWEWEETPELRAFIKKQSISRLSEPPTRPQQYAIITELRGKTQVRGTTNCSPPLTPASVVKLVNTPDLKSVERNVLAGSSPATRISC